eukprot:CAMPEP_0170536908 /NCGR_PEP_ID=MMETSP0209-20121228/102408_1 /TAXON_ID=665100 ORGANISM="Litonotus pictus, Strain P1" /NCGR_SAMPLE_ID=MMETSP0209 /ASSEMBLY_ACC=CAM_ASM_000301 /LENGTH=912 /DNA_ID=CAMNT_0010838327 /DNA_START=63 /DNA_END=2802 /DNA_ORIENTATION=+
MLGKKRTKEEEGLHSDETVLEFQNRSLISRVKEQREEISSIKSQLDLLKNQSSLLSKAFMEVNCRLLSMVDSLSILMCEMELEPEKSSEENCIVGIGLDLLGNLKGDFSKGEQLTDQHASMMENIKNNIETIVAKLIGGIGEVNREKVTGELGSKFLKLQKELNEKNQELSLLKSEKIDYSSLILKKDSEIADLNSKLSVLNRKEICNPLIPYIKYSKELFKSIKPEHTCTCHVCGEDFQALQNQFTLPGLNTFTAESLSQVNSQIIMNSNGGKSLDSESIKNNLYNVGNLGLGSLPVNSLGLNPINNNINMNINVMNQQPFNQIQSQSNAVVEETVSKEEYEILKKRFENLSEEYEDLSLRKNISINENIILESDCFGSIVQQSEHNIGVIELLKDQYIKLKGKYDESYKEYDLDVKKIEERILRSNESYRKKYYDLKDENNRLGIKFEEPHCFGSIVQQSEHNIGVIELLKDQYIKLKGKYDESYKEYDLDVKKIEEKILRSNESYRKKYYDLKDENNRLGIKFEETSAKLQEMQTLREDTVHFDKLYNYFDTEKKRMSSELSNILKLLTEQRERCQSEIERTNTIQEEQLAIKSELDETKIKLKASYAISSNTNSQDLPLSEHTHSIPIDEKSLKYKNQELANSLKQRKDKLTIIEKKYNKLKEELQSEKQMNEALLRELEANEQGLMEMNSQLKHLQEQISNENQKVAKLTKEKINDQRNLERLAKEREASKELLTAIKDNKAEAENQIKLLHEEIGKLNDSLENTSQIIQSKDNQLQAMEVHVREAEKNQKENETLNEREKKLNVELKKNNCALKREIDLSNKKDLLKENEYSPEGIRDMEQSIDLLTKKLKCEICFERYKDVVITKCFHTFCKQCVDKSFESRQRRCPHCREKISENDVKAIFFNY